MVTARGLRRSTGETTLTAYCPENSAITLHADLRPELSQLSVLLLTLAHQTCRPQRVLDNLLNAALIRGGSCRLDRR